MGCIKPMLKTSRTAYCGVNDRRVFFNGIFWVFRRRSMDRATPALFAWVDRCLESQHRRARRWRMMRLSHRLLLCRRPCARFPRAFYLPAREGCGGLMNPHNRALPGQPPCRSYISSEESRRRNQRLSISVCLSIGLSDRFALFRSDAHSFSCVCASRNHNSLSSERE